MTRKDFELVAGALKEVRHEVESSDDATERAVAYGILHRANSLIADALRSTNPRFDRDRFLRAVEGDGDA